MKKIDYKKIKEDIMHQLDYHRKVATSNCQLNTLIDFKNDDEYQHYIKNKSYPTNLTLLNNSNKLCREYVKKNNKTILIKNKKILLIISKN